MNPENNIPDTPPQPAAATMPSLAANSLVPAITALDEDKTRFVFELPQSDDEIIAEIVRRAELILGPRAHETFPVGTHLTEEGQPVQHVIFALSGKVALERQSEAGEILMHHASTGRIIGLLGAGDESAAFFTSIVTEEVTGIRATLSELNQVIFADSYVLLLVAALFLRTLDRRLRRAEALHVEQAELADQLALERTNLAKALTKLRETREEMAAQARFASLGELAAGVAHELNNPVAAIRRGADYLDEDIKALIATCPDRAWRELALQSLGSAENASVRSTKEVRAAKKELAKIIKDPSLVERLVVAGVFDPDMARALLASGNTPDLGALEQSAAIGTNLRNLRNASGRIVELVASLRSYARPDGDPVENVNVNDGLSDTLRLLSHRLDKVEVSVEYGELPPISCHPGQLDQVWTNLITNAVEAMTDAAPQSASTREDATNQQTTVGSLTIETSALTSDSIRLTFRDTGPGIAADVIDYIFEPHFTTKGGEVRFGMGIGLGVCRSIVENHGGTIRLENVENPTGTLATVELPTHYL